MVFQFFKGGESTIDVVEATLVQMVLDGRDVYDTAMEALFGGGKSKETKRELKSTDRGINTAQQDVRRDLMLHASVNDTVDLPLVLAYMSTVKDAERIGDYSKNFYDLVKYGADFEDAPDHELLADYRDRVSKLLVRCGRNVQRTGRGTCQGPHRQSRRFPRRIRPPREGCLAVDRSGIDAVARALYFRFLKRITAHVMNFLTSLVLPVDRLDYYDESKDDQASSQPRENPRAAGPVLAETTVSKMSGVSPGSWLWLSALATVSSTQTASATCASSSCRFRGAEARRGPHRDGPVAGRRRARSPSSGHSTTP